MPIKVQYYKYTEIHAPFDSDEYKDKDLETIVSSLEDSGFTNIQTDAVQTTKESEANHVTSIKIDSNTEWDESDAWKADVPIKIQYYEYAEILDFKVKASISTGGLDGEPVFTIKTNLPDGTLLDAELVLDGIPAEGQDDYIETQEIEVKDGEAITEPFTNNGEPLIGNYAFSIVMLPGNQTQGVQSITGANGEALTGNFVEANGNYRYIFISTYYISPVSTSTESANNTQESDQSADEEISEELQENFAKALSGFGDDYKITLEGYLFTVSVWGDGLAETASLANYGYNDAVNAWNDIVESTATASENLQELLNVCGYEDYMVEIKVLNNVNMDYTLLSAMWGIITYNCVS